MPAGAVAELVDAGDLKCCHPGCSRAGAVTACSAGAGLAAAWCRSWPRVTWVERGCGYTVVTGLPGSPWPHRSRTSGPAGPGGFGGALISSGGGSGGRSGFAGGGLSTPDMEVPASSAMSLRTAVADPHLLLRLRELVGKVRLSPDEVWWGKWRSRRLFLRWLLLRRRCRLLRVCH